MSSKAKKLTGEIIFYFTMAIGCLLIIIFDKKLNDTPVASCLGYVFLGLFSIGWIVDTSLESKTRNVRLDIYENCIEGVGLVSGKPVPFTIPINEIDKCSIRPGGIIIDIDSRMMRYSCRLGSKEDVSRAVDLIMKLKSEHYSDRIQA